MSLDYLIEKNIRFNKDKLNNKTLSYALDNTRMSCINKDYNSILKELNHKNKIIKKF